MGMYEPYNGRRLKLNCILIEWGCMNHTMMTTFFKARNNSQQHRTLH